MKRKQQGTTYHICHHCLNGFFGRVDAKFCSNSCRSGNWKYMRKRLVCLLETFFVNLGFTVEQFRDYVDSVFDRIVRVANLLGYFWNDIARMWEYAS